MPMIKTTSFTTLLALFFLITSFTSTSHAEENSFEVGTGTIANTFNPNPVIFTTFTFAKSFAQSGTPDPDQLPLIFILPSTQGGDECDVRIRNVTLTTFDAYCTEAPPRDGEHVAVNIQYIALLPGVTTIPTTSGGSVTFEAGTVETQTVQHNCPGAAGCGPEGWDIITPTAVSPGNAAILGQIQTMNNESGNPPTTSSQPFLSTAIDPTQGGANQFGLALERSEVDEGSISDDEQIAWLAIEDTGGCETLDFSGLGGPASVAFQAIVTDDLAAGAAGGDIHDAPDGWNDGCNASEGATFEMGCFTNTPVVLANKRTRNEGDGGWLRQCGISSTGLTVTIDEDRSTDNERNHADEGISVLAFGQAFSTPVTLSQIAITQLDRTVNFSWETSTETFNIGFNLWGKIGNDWRQLNRRLIPSNRRDKLAPHSYKKRIRLSAYQRDQISQFGISSVDVHGKDEFFGPFVAGQSYGEQAIPEPIDWQSIKASFDQRMLSKGYRFIHGRWQKPRDQPTVSPETRIDISIDQTGLYRITHDDLVALGIDWQGEKTRDIAISHKGKAVARFVTGSRGQVTSNTGIEFFATIPQNEDALYTKTNVYQLQLDRSLALAMPRIDHKAVADSNTSNTGFASQLLGENKLYTELSTGDPWMDSELFSYGTPVEKIFNFEIDSDVAVEKLGRLKLSLTGGIDYPGSDQDHHIQVSINNKLIIDARNDGFDRWLIDTEIPSSTFLQGDNAIKLHVPGDTGFDVDIVNIDTIELLSAKDLTWSDQNQALQFTASDNSSNFRIAVENNAIKPRVYVTQRNGNVARATRISRDSSAGFTSWLLPITAMQNELDTVDYWVGTPQQMLSPTLSLRSNADLLSTAADYLIIAHPSFIGEPLQAFAQRKTDEGLNTQIVNWLDIVQDFGYGIPTPQALRTFLTLANQEFNYEYVLLVGGHSYDYLDYNNQGAINFIPTWHRPIDIIQQAPTDTPFIELDGDGKPDKAIGRWPVRTQDDLTTIIQKNNEWHDNGMNNARSALFIAEQIEANRDFDQLLEQSMTQVSKRWDDIERVYMDDILSNTPSNAINTARQTILDTINSGVGLTVFNGHGSPSSWTFQSLVSWQHLQQLENSGLPTMVMPLACYTTYYQTPTVNSLAHQWLFNQQDNGQSSGAVAIHGAMVLGDYRENGLFAEKVLKQQLARKKTIGQAILSAKRQLAPWNHMVNNWALLGDPSLQLEP